MIQKRWSHRLALNGLCVYSFWNFVDQHEALARYAFDFIQLVHFYIFAFLVFSCITKFNAVLAPSPHSIIRYI